MVLHWSPRQKWLRKPSTRPLYQDTEWKMQEESVQHTQYRVDVAKWKSNLIREKKSKNKDTLITV